MEPINVTPSAIRAELLRLAEQGNKPFTQSLNPGVPNVLGIRIPHLRELAKKIAKGDWQAYLATADTYYMEERMLQGMVLGCIRPDKDVEVYLERVTRFVRLINSWSVCDTFPVGLPHGMDAGRGRVRDTLRRGDGDAAVHRRGAHP